MWPSLGLYLPPALVFPYDAVWTARNDTGPNHHFIRLPLSSWQDWHRWTGILYKIEQKKSRINQNVVTYLPVLCTSPVLVEKMTFRNMKWKMANGMKERSSIDDSMFVLSRNGGQPMGPALFVRSIAGRASFQLLHSFIPQLPNFLFISDVKDDLQSLALQDSVINHHTHCACALVIPLSRNENVPFLIQTMSGPGILRAHAQFVDGLIKES